MTNSEENNEDLLPEPTKVESKQIKAISKDAVHKICSGQVVLSLAVAVKELVENSIDAGATFVEVKLKDQGLDSVEVSDNGGGVEESNIKGMTAKYHTSKLRQFEDLQGVETFGFRGEALSSLCALSEMTIITRHSSSEAGLRIELDNEGDIKKRSACARQVGTTVILANLFATLPVRKREFSKNIKREFSKMCTILQSYCMVAANVRILCTNTNPKGVKSTIMSTNGSPKVLDNIQAIFGSKQSAELVQMKSPFMDSGKLTREDLNVSGFDDTKVNDEDLEMLNMSKFEMEGWISNSNHGSGRNSKDRQFFFVNARPCDPKNVAKVVNEIYRRYNMSHFPFVFLNVITERAEVDVNLTPDKRQLLINNEKILLLAIKKSLLNTFGNSSSTLNLKNSTLNFQPIKKTNEVTEEDTVPNKQKFLEVLTQWKNTGETDISESATKPFGKRKHHTQIEEKSMKMRKIQEYLSQTTVELDKNDDLFEHLSGKAPCLSQSTQEGSVKEEVDDVSIILEENSNSNDVDEKSISENEPTSEIEEPEEILSSPKSQPKIFVLDCKTTTKKEKHPLVIENLKPIKFDIDSSEESVSEDEIEHIEVKPIITVDEQSDSEDTTRISNSVSTEITTTIEEIRKVTMKEQNLKQTRNGNRLKLNRLKFKSKINPNDNKKAEDELEREISKDMFFKMEIIGQFNLGFIIVKLENDMFIVDQHASDEKYNFEMLQKEVIMQHQKLTIPQNLELTAVNEMILIEYLDVFEKNGFKFSIDEDAPPTKRVKLISKPFSKQWEFGKEDIDELIFILQDAPKGTICRPSRIRKMFASRACRKSVMIGKALDKKVMRSLIDHMGTMDLPWNCPHGRPTMRYLVNLALLDEESDEM
ncbi:hypothetical protein ACFFRR_001705 [Megaselia abdita]